MKKKRWLITTVLFSMILSACACSKASNNDVVCGGVKDKTDVNAPKEIKSTEIESLSVSFFIEDMVDYDRSGSYAYTLKKVAADRYEVKSSGVYSHEIEMTKTQVEELQKIIEKYELIKSNGKDKVTAGLAPEYGPVSIYVTYESGEKLSVRENGNPREEWTLALRDCFDKAFSEAGFSDAKPKEEALVIERFGIEFNIDNVSYGYGLIQHTDDNTYFYCSAFDMTRGEEVQFKLAYIKPELFENLQKLIEKYNLNVLNIQNAFTLNNPENKDFLCVYIDYESGRQIYGEFMEDDIPDEWSEAETELKAYMDKYIEENLMSE